ncbi:UNVERIFIED_CONTAM: putative lipoprotein YajG [Jeotgalibacillus campisalis]
MRKTGGVVVVLLTALAVAGCASKEPEANPYQYTPTAEAEVTVDASTVSTVKAECEAQLKAVAKNSGREIAGVPPKPYEIVSVTFTGDVKKVNLPYDRTAWDVPLTVVNRTPDGKTTTKTETCRYRELQKDASML